MVLPPHSLDGLTVALSASRSRDLYRLGLLEEHLRLALGEIARSVLTLGGTLQYCGHLEPEGYTAFLIEEARRYSRRDAPLQILLAWSVHRRRSLQQLREAEQDLGLLGQIHYLDIDGAPTNKQLNRKDAPSEVAAEDRPRSLTAMRTRAADSANARVLIGGKRTGYGGTMPGVLEEALLALERGTPLYLAGGYGGATSDAIRAFAPEAMEWLPSGTDVIDDAGYTQALELIVARANGASWEALGNGLTVAENLHLAATHRASEVAALVSLGLGRLHASSGE